MCGFGGEISLLSHSYCLQFRSAAAYLFGYFALGAGGLGGWEGPNPLCVTGWFPGGLTCLGLNPASITNPGRMFIQTETVMLLTPLLCHARTANMVGLHRGYLPFLIQLGLYTRSCQLANISHTPTKGENISIKVCCKTFHSVSRKHVQAGNCNEMLLSVYSRFSSTEIR